jgi:hypothetical protein
MRISRVFQEMDAIAVLLLLTARLGLSVYFPDYSDTCIVCSMVYVVVNVYTPKTEWLDMKCYLCQRGIAFYALKLLGNASLIR